MPRKVLIRRLGLRVALPWMLGTVVAGTWSVARADDEMRRPLDVTVEESEGQTVVHVRDPNGDLAQPKIATSHSGFMLSFEGEVVEKGHQRTNAWRLGRVQSGQYGDRAVIRLIQRRGRRGAIDDHAQVVEVDDGLDIVVVDRLAAPPAMTPDVGATATTDAPPSEAADDAVDDVGANADEAPSTAQTVAALQAELGPAPDAPAAEPGDETPTLASVSDSAADATEDLGDLEDPAPDADADPAPFDLSPADAEPPAAAGPFAADDEANSSAPQLNFAAWTLIPSIFALAGLGLWMKRRKQTATGAALEVVAKTSLGPKQQIVQVKVDGRELLLGVTEHQIGLITEVGGAPTQAAAATARSAVNAPRTSAHHEFGVPAPVADREDQAASNRIEAFKAKLSSALRNEVVSSDTGDTSVDGRSGADPRPADLGELRRLLDRRGEDPAWTREEVA